MKTLLILGGSGLVGSSLVKKFVEDFEIVATFRNNETVINNCKWIKLNLINDKKGLRELIETESPDFVINTIAYSNVDYCETHKEDAHFLHVECTEEIAKVCNDIKSKLIYISTDWVFDNSKNLFSEDDIPNPMNYYGQTRLMAEKTVLNHNPENLIVRPAVVYGWHKNSKFLNFVLNTLKAGKEVFAFTDQYSTPTLVDDLVNCIMRLIKSDSSGIFHTTGSSCTNRYEFAKIIAKKFSFDEGLIKPTTVKERPQTATRPKISCLDNSKAKNQLGVSFCTIDEGIEKVLEQSRFA